MVWGYGMRQKECFKATLYLLFCLGCLDSQFLSISVSAQTTAFIPACDNMHWFKLMSKHTVMCERSNLHMLHHHLNCQGGGICRKYKVIYRAHYQNYRAFARRKNQLELDPELNGRVRKPS